MRSCLRHLGQFGLFLSLGFSISSMAQHYPSLDSDLNLESAPHLAPNELSPGTASPILKTAPEGVYVAVGTERGFIGAALAENVTDLLLIDRNIEIVYFNQLNIALLRTSKNRQDYLKLRLHSSFEEWRSRLEKADLDSTSRKFLSSEKAFNWWQTNVRNNSAFKLFHRHPEQIWVSPDGRLREIVPPEGPPFFNANYLHYDVLYEKIKSLADAGRIGTALQDLASLTIEDLSVILQNKVVSVLDISNAWAKDYLGSLGVAKLLQTFSIFTRHNSLFLTTSPKRHWRYLGHTFRTIQKRGIAKFAEEFEAIVDAEKVPEDLLTRASSLIKSCFFAFLVP